MKLYNFYCRINFSSFGWRENVISIVEFSTLILRSALHLFIARYYYARVLRDSYLTRQ